MIRPQLGVVRSEISLRAHPRAFFFVLVVGGASLFVAAEAVLLGTVSSFETPEVGRRLLALDAGDPRLQHRLGQAYKDTDPSEGLLHLRRATELSPASRLYWSDLELACESRSDTQCVDQAAEQLARLCPMVPSYHWLMADYYLRTNRLDVALQEFRRLLELDPKYATATWGSLQALQKPETIFQEMLADNRDAKLRVGYVDFLSDQGDHDSAYRIWRLVAADSRPFPFSSAAPYLQRLIDLGRIKEAVNVWQDLERLGIVKTLEANVAPRISPASAPALRAAGRAPALAGGATPPEAEGLPNEKGNLVFNGDFEQEPLNAGFDWRAVPTTYLAVDFSAPGAYRGAHCLRVDFTVSRNDEYEPVYQIVPVLPRHAYTLQAFVRSQDITSDSGPCLRVSDTQPGGFPDAVSEITVGTTPWHSVRLSFSTGPHTRTVRLSIWRPRSRVFPTEISGTSWLDAVTLHSEPAK